MYAGDANPNRGPRAYGKVEDAIVVHIRKTGGATIRELVDALDRGGKLGFLVQRRNAALANRLWSWKDGVSTGKLSKQSFVKRRLEYLKKQGTVEYDGKVWRAIKCSTSTMQWSREHGGALPTRQTARDFGRQLDPQPSTPKPLKHVTEIHQLREENRQLRQRVRQLERENAALKKG